MTSNKLFKRFLHMIITCAMPDFLHPEIDEVFEVYKQVQRSIYNSPLEWWVINDPSRFIRFKEIIDSNLGAEFGWFMNEAAKRCYEYDHDLWPAILETDQVMEKRAGYELSLLSPEEIMESDMSEEAMEQAWQSHHQYLSEAMADEYTRQHEIAPWEQEQDDDRDDIASEQTGPCTNEPWCACHRCEEAAMKKILYTGPPTNMVAPCPDDWDDAVGVSYNQYVRWDAEKQAPYWDAMMYDVNRADAHECPWQDALPMLSYCDVAARETAYHKYVAQTQPMHGPDLPTCKWRYDEWRKTHDGYYANISFSELVKDEGLYEDWVMTHSVVTQDNVRDFWLYMPLPF